MYNVLVFLKNSHFLQEELIVHFFMMQNLVILLKGRTRGASPPTRALHCIVLTQTKRLEKK